MSGKGHQPPPPELLEKTAAVAAQQKAMERSCRLLPHGSRLFEAEQGWESLTISRGEGVAVADTLLSLEQALHNPENRIIFIPLGALMTDQDIEKVCQRNAATRTLFKEVKKS
jgi:hypothetical protein